MGKKDIRKKKKISDVVKARRINRMLYNEGKKSRNF